MEIREDFKVDFDSWKKEAKSLCIKSIPIILIFSFIIPSILFFTVEKFSEALNISDDIKLILALIIFSVIVFTSAFYTMFFFKRVDFEESYSIPNMLKDIINSKSNIKEYFLIHRLSLLFVLLIPLFVIAERLISSATVNPSEHKGILDIISGSLLLSFISFFIFLSSNDNRIFGIVYIAYGMVNKDGAAILTKQAYSKYPELEAYVLKNSFYFMAYYLFTSLLVFSPNVIFTLFVISLFIVVCNYYTAIYYLISRDLYGGKTQKSKVSDKVEDKNIVYNPA